MRRRRTCPHFARRIVRSKSNAFGGQWKMIGGEADFLLNSVPESGNRGPVTLHSSMAERLPSPPPLPPKESLTKRYKLIWRVLLISNLALGAYMFARARKKDLDIVDSKAPKTRAKENKAPVEVPSPPITTTPFFETLALPRPVIKSLKVRKPISEDEQRELLKWMLEEKRKVISKDSQEKKQIDEDKAILKQLIGAKSIPKF